MMENVGDQCSFCTRINQVANVMFRESADVRVKANGQAL